MSVSVDYDIATALAPDGVLPPKIYDEIAVSGLGGLLQNVKTSTGTPDADGVLSTGTLSLIFSAPLDAGQQITLDGIVANHDPTPSPLNATGTTTVTTTSTATYVLAPGMSVTPLSGSYRTVFAGVAGNSSGHETVSVAIYTGGSLVAGTEKLLGIGQSILGTGDNYRISFSSEAEIVVNGNEVVEGRWHVSGSTGYMTSRSLRLERIA